MKQKSTSLRFNMDQSQFSTEQSVDDYETDEKGKPYKKYFTESKSLLRIAIPMLSFQMITNLMAFLILTESVIICGQLGKYEMDGAALANSFVNFGGVAIAVGFCTACDTFFSQIFGSEHKKFLGTMLQRSILISICVPLVLIAFHINLEPILLLFGQEPIVARNTTRYMTLFSPAFIFIFQSILLTRYLQNQYYVIFPMISTTIANAFNVGSQYLFVIYLEYGFDASAICQAFTYFLNWFMQLLFILISGLYKENWTGWSYDCLLEWGIFFSLALPGMALLFLEVFSWEIGTLLSGILGVSELGAQSVLFHYETALFQACFAIGVAVNIRVGEALGLMKWRKALLTYRCGLCVTLIYGIVMAVTFLIIKNFAVSLFSNDNEVIKLATNAFPIMSVALLMDFLGTITMGALRGCGRQKVGVLLVILGYYILGQPIGISLAFLTNLSINGLWFGLVISLAISNGVGFTYVNFFQSWKHQQDLAQERIRKSMSETEDRVQKPNEFNKVQRKHKVSISMVVSSDSSIKIMSKNLLHSKTEFKRIYMKRILTYVIVLCILFIGLGVRLLLPTPSCHNCTAFQTPHFSSKQ